MSCSARIPCASFSRDADTDINRILTRCHWQSAVNEGEVQVQVIGVPTSSPGGGFAEQSVIGLSSEGG